MEKPAFEKGFSFAVDHVIHWRSVSTSYVVDTRSFGATVAYVTSVPPVCLGREMTTSTSETWDATETTPWGINQSKLDQRAGKRWFLPLTLRGLCTTTAASAFSCLVWTYLDGSHMRPPANKSQRLQTGGWLWKLFVTEYTRSTRIWMQHWTCLVAMTGCVIIGVVMVR